MDNLFRGYGVRIELPAKPNEDDVKEKYRDAFHVVKETLTRIGIASEKTKSLYQTVHILHKRGEYALLHFKELFALDGKVTDLNAEDINRRNAVATLLQEWGLLKVLDKVEVAKDNTHLKIISFADKGNWKLHQKYKIGLKKTT